MYVEAYETSSSYKSQIYNAFVISDVRNRSLCVIPFSTLKPDLTHALHSLSRTTLTLPGDDS